MKIIKKYKYVIIIVLVLIISGGIYYSYKYKTKNWKNSTDIDLSKIMEDIKITESKKPLIIEKEATDDDIYNNPYVQHIRVAINGYLNGTSVGVEEGALNATNNEMKCGLNNFNKDTYKGKFVILDALDNDYGGVQTYITFVDRPDLVFWVWIYQLGGSDETLVLRAFCESKPPNTEQKEIIKEIISDPNYYL